MIVNDDIFFHEKGFSIKKNRLVKMEKGYPIAEMCRRGNCKCQCCQESIPGSVFRWTFSRNPYYFCPECLDKLSFALVTGRVEELNLKKASPRIYLVNNRIFIDTDSRRNCNICKNKINTERISLTLKHQFKWWTNKWHNYSVCSECLNIMANESHIDNYDKVKEKWICQRIARKV